MTPLEVANTRVILEHYVLAEPNGDPTQAIMHERWLEHQDIGWLQVFEDAVKCLDIVLRRVLEKRSAGHADTH